MRSHAPIVAALTFATLSATPSAVAAFVADSVFATVRAHDVHGAAADWPAIEAEFRSRLATASTEADSARAIVRVFERLGDVHSHLIVRGAGYAWWRPVDDSTLARLQPLVARGQSETGVTRTATLGGRWRYVRLSGIRAWGTELPAATQAVADSVCSGGEAAGVVLDLRVNNGGQLSAMVAGLAALFGDGDVGSSVDRDGRVTRTFAVKGGAFLMNGVEQARSRARCGASFRDLPVAVLVGPVTMSSGSITALMLRGRPHVRLFGEPTADGYTTGNDYFWFDANTSMNLATGVLRDRAGRAYPGAVTPDEVVVAPWDLDHPERDPVVQRAVKWLESGGK